MHAYLYNTYIYHTKQEVAPPLHLPTVKSWAFSSPGFTSKGSTLIDLVFLSRLSWPFCCFFSGDEMGPFSKSANSFCFFGWLWPNFWWLDLGCLWNWFSNLQISCSKVSKVANHPFSRHAKKKEILPNWRQNTTLQPFSSSQQVVLLMDGGPPPSPTIKGSAPWLKQTSSAS